MYATFLIGLREGLEAALIVGILIAYLVKIERRDLLWPLWLGVAVAATGSLALGLLLTYGPYGLTFQAQEIIGGVLSLVAAAMITWMILWMARTAGGIKHELETGLERAVLGGIWGVALLSLMAVGREGLETALFVWSTVGPGGSMATATQGALLGIGVAIVIEIGLYFGVVQLDLARFFTWTGWLLIFIAAGVVVYGLGDLQEAGVLPGFGHAVADLSALVPINTWWGVLIGAIFNIPAEPTALQVIAWLLYLVVVSTLYVRVLNHSGTRPPVPETTVQSIGESL